MALSRKIGAADDHVRRMVAAHAVQGDRDRIHGISAKARSRL
jgi:hypothetical protein